MDINNGGSQFQMQDFDTPAPQQFQLQSFGVEGSQQQFQPQSFGNPEPQHNLGGSQQQFQPQSFGNPESQHNLGGSQQQFQPQSFDTEGGQQQFQSQSFGTEGGQQQFQSQSFGNPAPQQQFQTQSFGNPEPQQQFRGMQQQFQPQSFDNPVPQQQFQPQSFGNPIQANGVSNLNLNTTNSVYNDDIYYMSSLDWFLTVLIFLVPLLNIIKLFQWSFADNCNPNKRNFARASLLAFCIFIVLAVVITPILTKVLGG